MSTSKEVGPRWSPTTLSCIAVPPTCDPTHAHHLAARCVVDRVVSRRAGYGDVLLVQPVYVDGAAYRYGCLWRFTYCSFVFVGSRSFRRTNADRTGATQAREGGIGKRWR